jgi:hypothetical protein
MREVRVDPEDVDLLRALLRAARSDAIKAGGALSPFLPSARAGAAADRDRMERIENLLEGAHSIVARVVEGQG